MAVCARSLVVCVKCVSEPGDVSLLGNLVSALEVGVFTGTALTVRYRVSVKVRSSV